MTQQTSKSLVAMLPLFIVLFIDGMGLGLLFPILNGIIVDPTSGFLTEKISMSHRDFLYGFTVGIFMICWFFGAAVLGDLSDNIGRKKSLMICLFGSFIGYFLSAIAIFMHSILMIIIGRMIAGFTAGSQPIAQAAIVDVSVEEYKARNIGLVLLAVSLGFILGPMIGGVLSESSLVHWFDYSTPLFFAALISILNAVFLYFMFSETFQTSGKFSIKLHHAIFIFISAFRHHKIRWLSVVMLVMIFGWSNYFAFISLYLLHVFNYSTLKISLFMAVMGLGFSIGFGYLVDFFVKRYSLKNTVIVAILVTGFVVFLTVITKNEIVAWIGTLIIGITMSIAYATIISLFSNQVSENEQGWIMGVTGSIMALCFGLTSFFTGWVASFSFTLPLYLATSGMILSGFLLSFYRDKR